MAERGVGVADTANADGVAEVAVVETASATIKTTTTADPGTAGTSLAVTSRSLFPQTGNFKIRVEAEVMLVTAGWGTGAGNFTVTRAQDGTTAAAHASGVIAAQVVAVQLVTNIDATRIVTYEGRVNSFRTPGRAGTVGQKILSLHNATASPVKVRVIRAWADLAVTVVKLVTVLPPIIRMWKVTVLPTNGTALTKVPIDSLFTSSSSVTVLGDALADGSGSATTLTATLPAGTIFTQEFAGRLITGAGYEPADRVEFLDGEDAYVTLNALEGVVVFVDYVLATQNPITDMWIAGIEWEEFTLA